MHPYWAVQKWLANRYRYNGNWLHYETRLRNFNRPAFNSFAKKNGAAFAYTSLVTDGLLTTGKKSRGVLTPPLSFYPYLSKDSLVPSTQAVKKERS